MKSSGVSRAGQQTLCVGKRGEVGMQASMQCLWFSMDKELVLRTTAEILDVYQEAHF